MDGGLLFRALERTVGWKRAKHVKRLAYRLGYDRVALARQARSQAQRSTAWAGR
jgi:hypothetical protein